MVRAVYLSLPHHSLPIFRDISSLFGYPVHTTVIKQRMQVHQSEFRSALACARTVYRNEGLSAFYVSYPTTLTMTVPFTAVQFTVYEQIKALLNPSGAYSPATHIVAGGLAGAVAGAATTPLDVAKTLLQTRGTSGDAEIRHCRGLADAFRIIWRRDGAKGFARGLAPRVLTFMPSNALCWLSYEFFSEFGPWLFLFISICFLCLVRSEMADGILLCLCARTWLFPFPFFAEAAIRE